MSIPTEVVRVHRNMATDTTCPICQAAPDTWRHALLDCNMSRAVWALADEELVEHVIMNRTDDARLWIFWLFDTLKQDELAVVLVTLWALWWARRRAIHDEEFQDPLSTWGFITRYSDEIQVSAKPKKVTVNQGTTRTRRKWIAPEAGWFKVNVDGGFSRDGRKGAAAAVCHDDSG